jgi:hypothetical protein
VRFALSDVVPRIIIQSLHLRVGEFESHLAKRLLQQYLPTGDIAVFDVAEAPSQPIDHDLMNDSSPVSVGQKFPHLATVEFAFYRASKRLILFGASSLLMPPNPG